MIISLADAKLNGLKYYFTGMSCKNGNVAPRYTNDRSCTCDICRSIKADKKRQWVEKNIDRHYATSKKWRESNPEDYKNKQKQYHINHRETRLASQREYTKINSDKFLAKNAKRRSLKLNAFVEWDIEFTNFLLAEAYNLAKRREELTGFEWHVDHMIPLQADSVCGLHVWNNFQVIPAKLNLYKNNKLILTQVGEWLR